MRVLVTKKRPTQRYLVYLFTKALIKEVRNLIKDKKHSKAIVTILRKGILARKVIKDEMRNIRADLILSDRNAQWDHMK